MLPFLEPTHRWVWLTVALTGVGYFRVFRRGLPNFLIWADITDVNLIKLGLLSGIDEES
jgi:hypothetical protein